MILSRLYRLSCGLARSLACAIRRSHYRLKYPGVEIDRSSTIRTGVLIHCGITSSVKILNSTVERNAVIVAEHGGSVEIRDSFVGGCTWIVARNSVTIGPHAQIAELVSIRDNDHCYGGGLLPHSGFTTQPISIGRNVWIGAKATITKGVEIEENSVVAANAVVRANIPPNTVYGGVPAKKLKDFSPTDALGS